MFCWSRALSPYHPSQLELVPSLGRSDPGRPSPAAPGQPGTTPSSRRRSHRPAPEPSPRRRRSRGDSVRAEAGKVAERDDPERETKQDVRTVSKLRAFGLATHLSRAHGSALIAQRAPSLLRLACAGSPPEAVRAPCSSTSIRTPGFADPVLPSVGDRGCAAHQECEREEPQE